MHLPSLCRPDLLHPTDWLVHHPQVWEAPAAPHSHTPGRCLPPGATCPEPTRVQLENQADPQADPHPALPERDPAAGLVPEWQCPKASLLLSFLPRLVLLMSNIMMMIVLIGNIISWRNSLICLHFSGETCHLFCNKALFLSMEGWIMAIHIIPPPILGCPTSQKVCRQADLVWPCD